MNTKAKLNERLTFSKPDVWVPMSGHDQVVAVGHMAVTSPPTTVTVQLRKATDANGTGADDLGAAVAAETVSSAQAYAEDLGETAGGVPFTHVSAVITDGGSPDSAVGTVIRGDARFNP